MKSIYCAAMSLDGFIAGPNDELDWWFQIGQPQEDYDSFYRRVGSIAMGANTFRWIHENYVLSGEGWPFDVPTWVLATRPIPQVPGADVRTGLTSINQVHLEARLASRDGDLWVLGGGGLASSFLSKGLLDEVIVQVAPIMLGSGKRAFGELLELRGLTLNHIRLTERACVEMHYLVPPLQPSCELVASG